GNLHSTEDYIKALQNVFNVPELKLYLEKNILVSPMDYPGQFYVRRAISSCINSANLLDPVIFQSGYRPAYKEAMFRVWMLFHRYGRKNYNKLPLAFFSDVFYWFTTHHPMASIIEQNFHLFNDYYVENFHSSLHLQTNKSNSSEAAIFLLELLMRMFNNHDNVVKIDAS
ncbi:1520_t:CDS:2, partial [Entrophospora sp. SA101]